MADTNQIKRIEETSPKNSKKRKRKKTESKHNKHLQDPSTSQEETHKTKNHKTKKHKTNKNLQDLPSTSQEQKEEDHSLLKSSEQNNDNGEASQQIDVSVCADPQEKRDEDNTHQQKEEIANPVTQSASLSKKEKSNQRRLEAVKQRQAAFKEKKPVKQVQAKRIIFSDADLEGEEAKKGSSNLISDWLGNDDDNNTEENWEVKTLYEGHRGMKLLEYNRSMLDNRFKLDDRFKERDAIPMDRSQKIQPDPKETRLPRSFSVPRYDPNQQSAGYEYVPEDIPEYNPAEKLLDRITEQIRVGDERKKIAEERRKRAEVAPISFDIYSPWHEITSSITKEVQGPSNLGINIIVEDVQSAPGYIAAAFNIEEPQLKNLNQSITKTKKLFNLVDQDCSFMTHSLNIERAGREHNKNRFQLRKQIKQQQREQQDKERKQNILEQKISHKRSKTRFKRK